MRPAIPAALRFAFLCLLLTGLAANETAAATRSAAGPAARSRRTAPARLGPHDVLARVGSRVVTVADFNDRYFGSYPEFRPQPDSLGRVEFLGSLVNKELMGQVVSSAGYELNVEERALYRSYRESILSNLLYLRIVSSATAVSEDSLRRVAGFYGRELRLRLLRFPERAQAEFVRLQLLGGRQTWTAASEKYAVHSQKVVNGLSDWYGFDGLPIEIALQIWPLRLGEVSPVIVADGGYHLVQIAEERARKAPGFASLRPIVRISLRGLEREARRAAIQAQAKQGMDIVYDSTNVAWASQRFREVVHINPEGLGMGIQLDASVPSFTTEDASRRVVQWKDGSLTLSDIVREYTSMNLFARPNLSTQESFLKFVDAVVLRPRMIQYAEARGLEKDSVAVAILARRREELLVTRMVEDSVLSRVTVSDAERRAYYAARQASFTTYASVRFANIVRPTREAADAVRRALQSGASPDSIVDADSLRHVLGTGIATRRINESGNFQSLLFNEMRPGQTLVVGPGKDSVYAALHLISFDPGHLLPYEQVQSVIDESIRNQKGEERLNAMIARLSKRYRIESHPEWVMRFDLMDTNSAND
jgi:hypothetical protein